MNACTIIAANYLAHARVLAESFLEHHPGGRFWVLSLDDLRPFLTDADRFEVLGPEQIGIEAEELARMAMLYDVRELSTAVKPFLLRTLLDEVDHVAYIDPDIRVYRPMEEIAELARQHGLVLTPHNNRPFPRDGRRPSEQDIMIAGIYNLGFCAVGQGGRAFLDWWCERLARDCIADPANGLFVDQKWVDWAPGMFDHAIHKDTSVNIAYWNYFSRRFEHTDGAYLVDGTPLGFFHFSGFDPRTPLELSKHQDRIVVAGDAPLERILQEYADAMLAAGFLEVRSLPCRFDTLPDGTRIDDGMRRAYRRAVIRAEATGAALPPAPSIEDGAREFLDWLAGPIRNAGRPDGLSRYLDALREGRSDLLQAFPSMQRRADATRYLEWVRSQGAREMQVPPALAPPGSVFEAVEASEGVRPVVTVAGYFRAELGVGEAGRSVLAGLDAAGIDHVTITNDATTSRQHHAFEDRAPLDQPSDVNIVCVNADALPAFADDVGTDFFRDRYTIGLWFWEVEHFPAAMHGSFGLVDEVWVSSEFVRDAVQPHTVKPVRVAPIALRAPEPTAIDRAALGIPDGFMFLFVFDMLSVLERKNPLGLIDAYRRAFAPDEGTVLVIKTINGDQKPEDLARLQAEVDRHPDVVLVDQYLPIEQKHALTSICDAYVSLHRSEGLGLTMAEAMALGKPVIATGYSGNLAFMSDDDSYLVDWSPVRVGPHAPPYPAHATWAEPSLDHAAQLMRHVFEHPDEARARGDRARAAVRDRMSAERAGAFMATRIRTIRELPMTQLDPTTRRGPVGRAESFVRLGPENAWESGGGRFGTLFLRLVRRLLRPYTVRQREFETAVVEALQESLRSEVELRAEVDMLVRKLAELEAAARVAAGDLETPTSAERT